MTLQISDAMRNGIQGVTKHKIKPSQAYLAGCKQITEQIEEDHKNYAKTVQRASKVYVC
jgi:hypothetical protein